MRKIILSIGGEDWECIQRDGCVDVYQCFIRIFVGSIDGFEIPDETDEDEMVYFKTEIEEFLERVYFN